MDLFNNKKGVKILAKRIKIGEISHDIGLKREKDSQKAFENFISYNFFRIIHSLHLDLDKVDVESLKTVDIPEIRFLQYPHQCYCCGKFPEFKIENGELVEVDPHCVDLGDFCYDIDVPSGELVFCDWTDKGRDILNSIEKDGRIDVNSLAGQKQLTDLYMKHNIGTFYVGNTDPHILQKGNSIIVERPAFDENEDEVFSDESYEDKGFIYTDLWWCTFFDLKVYQELIHSDVSAKDAGAHVIINVESGKYHISYDVHAQENKDNVYSTYLRIEKI